jgi:Flp pilus assembly protein TadD
LGRPEEALAAYDRCISLRTGYAEAHFNRGNVLKELRRLKEALESYGQAITLNPRYVQAYNNRGTVFYELRQWTEALESYDRAVALKPDNAIAFNNRGNALKEIGRWEEALENYDRAIALKPEYVRAYNNRGVALHGLRRWEEARASYDQAISLDSNSPAPYWNKAQLENLLGNFEEGWRLFEWRWKEVQKAELRGFPQPLWLGAESLAGKTILIHAEQGLGDCIQFCRYVPLLELKGAQVVLEVPRPLRALIASLPGSRQLVERGETLPPVDFQCPMLSLPLALGTRVETIPRNVPYLFSDPQKELFWQARLGSRTRPRIGLVWSGRAEHSNDQHRSLSLKAFSSLLELPYEFHSLQKEYREKDQAWLSASTQLKDHAADLKDFSDTAALISQMDLVLSVDTSVAHLTGALGRPLWLLLPYLPDYRWFLDREDSPWYPTAVLFRQPAAGDWESVILKVVDRMRREFK